MKTFMLNRKEKEKRKKSYIYSCKKFRANGIRLHIQFRSFVFDQEHFKYQTIEFATAFLEDFKVFN